MSIDRLKGLVIILDGLGDRPCPQLNGYTPLEHAHTPIMDALAKNNQSGMMDPLLPGLPVDTHTGVGILLGLPSADAAFLCRGPIEAAGIGLDLQIGDLLFRANLATVSQHDHGFEIQDRRAGRISDNVDLLCNELQNVDVGNNITASLFPATQHRCVLRLRGGALSAQITDTDPGGKNVDSGILQASAIDSTDVNAQTTALAINRFTEIAYKLLNKHPANQQRAAQGLPLANGVITRGVGEYQNFKNLLSYLNLNVAVIAGESTILGLGNLFNFNSLTDSAFTALPDTDIEKKLNLAVESLNEHDLVYVHIKATDTTAHDKDPLAKSEFLNRFDTALGKLNLENLILGICADHSTDSNRGEHNGDPVPVLIHNPWGRRDLVEAFNETSCTAGALGRITAQGFLTSVLDAMACLSNYKPSEMAFYRLSN